MISFLELELTWQTISHLSIAVPLTFCKLLQLSILAIGWIGAAIREVAGEMIRLIIVLEIVSKNLWFCLTTLPIDPSRITPTVASSVVGEWVRHVLQRPYLVKFPAVWLLPSFSGELTTTGNSVAPESKLYRKSNQLFSHCPRTGHYPHDNFLGLTFSSAPVTEPSHFRSTVQYLMTLIW